MAATFDGTAPSGTITCAAIPRVRAASANAAPWLPDEWVTTPLRASESLNDQTALLAPRNLNAPILWKLSHLKCSSAPAIESMLLECSTGVLAMYGAIRSAARSTAAKSGIIGGSRD